MKLLVIVTTGPWSGSLPGAALRFVRAAKGRGHAVSAVYFRDEGVYHALRGRLSDGGRAQPVDDWIEAADPDTQLLLCSAAAQRRLSAPPDKALRLRECGLAELWRIAATCDRVLTF